MVRRNSHLEKLRGSYLFSEIDDYKRQLMKEDPTISLISLGTGDTSEPIAPYLVKTMKQAIADMGTLKGYQGYGPDFGLAKLRQQIAQVHYKGLVSPDEIFVSDGAGCDIARLQMLFGSNVTLAAQDPSYPAYVDNGVIMGQTGAYLEEAGRYAQVTPLSICPENNFFPDLSQVERTDLIALCSPNNPTGMAMDREQFAQIIDFAKQNRSIILYDAVYTPFIREGSIPQTIYEIPGSRHVAIECHSFSKSAGFTGIRLGWCAVPEELRYDDGSSVHRDWQRISTTCFNGASLISQAGGVAALEEEGRAECKALVDYYLENAHLMRQTLLGLGFMVYGGINAPYLWIHFPGCNSWELFREILFKAHVVTIPGAGFGKSGEGFIRLSAFGHREMIEEAIRRITNWAVSREMPLASKSLHG